MSLWGFPGGASGKKPTYQWRRRERHGFDPWVGEIPWRRISQAAHSSFLAWRIPVDRGAWRAYGPQGHKKSDTTEWLSMHAHGPVLVILNWPHGCKSRLAEILTFFLLLKMTSVLQPHPLAETLFVWNLTHPESLIWASRSSPEDALPWTQALGDPPVFFPSPLVLLLFSRSVVSDSL